MASYNCPGYFGVHQVGQADAAGADGRGHGDDVQHVHEVHLRPSAVEPEGDDEAQRAAVAGQAFVARPFPVAVRQELDGQEHLDERLHAAQVIFRLVEQAVAQAAAHEDADETVEEQRVELVVAYPEVAVFAAHDEVRARDTHYPQQAVVADGEPEEVEERRVGIPVDVE